MQNIGGGKGGAGGGVQEGNQGEFKWAIPYYRKLTFHEIKVLEINAT